MFDSAHKSVFVRQHERTRYGRVEFVRCHYRKRRTRKALTPPVR